MSIAGRERLDKVGHCLRDMIASIRDDPRRKETLKILQMPGVSPRKRKRDATTENLSDQQKKILRKLEYGFTGDAAELTSATRRS